MTQQSPATSSSLDLRWAALVSHLMAVPIRLQNLRRSSLLFWFVATAASFQYAFAYGRNLIYQIPVETFAWNGGISYPYRKRLLVRLFYSFALRLMHGHSHSFASGAVTAPALLLMMVAFVSVMVAILASRLMIAQVLGKRSPFLWLSLAVVVMCDYHYLLVNEILAQFPYDMPGMAFFGLGTYAAFARKRWLFYPVLLFGTLNRESTLFLPLFFLVFYLRDDRPLLQALRSTGLALYAEVIAQLVLWKVLVAFCERITGGSYLMHNMFFDDLYLMRNPYHWSTYLSLFAYIWIPYILFFNRIANIRLQRIALLIPLWMIAMFRYSDILEIRVNSEWIVYLTVCAALIVANSFQLRSASATAAHPTT